MSALARWGITPLLAAPVGAWALGLGNIELKSALNQPFQSQIDVISATPAELQGRKDALSPSEMFARYPAREPVAPQVAPPPVSRTESEPAAPVSRSAPPRAPASVAGGAYGPVQRGDTLWVIADRFRPEGVTINQMMVAMYRSNPDA